MPGSPVSAPPWPGLLATLTAEERVAIRPYLSDRQLPTGAELWRVGDADNYLAFIVAGSVELKVDTEFPGKQLVMGVFRAGAAVGASCLLNDLPRSTATKTLEPTTLLLLDRTHFATLTSEHPQIAIKLLKGMLLAESSRLHRAYARLASVF